MDSVSGPADPTPSSADTAGENYADRLNQLQGKWWKKLLPVQAPYRWNLRRRLVGRTLDVGCGNGRNLGALPAGSVGVDHNPHLVASARQLGLEAYTTEEFFADPVLSAPGSYDCLLAAHLIEHLEYDQAKAVLESYLPLVRPGGRILLITPQQRGYDSDPTHVVYTDFPALARLSAELGLLTVRQYSFPFPRRAGKLFIYNEFNHFAQRPWTTEEGTT